MGEGQKGERSNPKQAPVRNWGAVETQTDCPPETQPTPGSLSPPGWALPASDNSIPSKEAGPAPDVLALPSPRLAMAKGQPSLVVFPRNLEKIQ